MQMSLLTPLHADVEAEDKAEGDVLIATCREINCPCHFGRWIDSRALLDVLNGYKRRSVAATVLRVAHIPSHYI
jgi:hypothetical protein